MDDGYTAEHGHKALGGQLSLFKDENQVIRCKECMGNAELPYVTRFPDSLIV